MDDETTDEIYGLLRGVGPEYANMIAGWLDQTEELEFNLLYLRVDRAAGTVEVGNDAVEDWSVTMRIDELHALVQTHLAAENLGKRGSGVVGPELVHQLRLEGVRLGELERMGFELKLGE